MRNPINRRTFLKGTGALMPLPFLNLMEAKASNSASNKPPVRFISLFKPNGIHPPSWNINDGKEKSFQLAPLMKSFAKHKNDFIILDVNSSIGEGFDKIQKSKKSTILIIEYNKLRGIITEQDIFRRVLFKSNRKDLVKNFMTSPVIFVYEEDLLFYAVGKMRQSKLRHLPVVNMNDEVVGILNLHEALSAELGISIERIDSITFDKDEEGINNLKSKQIYLAETMMQEHIDPEDITYILSFLNNVIYRRSIRIAVNKTNKRNILKKIPEFCVLTMGSAGRMESFLYPDQDNGLIYNLDEKSIKLGDRYEFVSFEHFLDILYFL